MPSPGSLPQSLDAAASDAHPRLRDESSPSNHSDWHREGHEKQADPISWDSVTLVGGTRKENVVLEKTLDSPLDCKEIKPVNPKGNEP